MRSIPSLPRLLVIDDVYGRRLADRRNLERADFCGALLLKDVTGDEDAFPNEQTIRNPLAEAVFLRGQAVSSEQVVNDLERTMEFVEKRYATDSSWCLVLLDLCFITGDLNLGGQPEGVPAGHPEDKDPKLYFGLRVLEALRQKCPDLPVLILSANSKEDVSLKLSEQGAVGFVEKGNPSSIDVLKRAIEKHGLIRDDALGTEANRIVGSSRTLLRVLRTARLAARSRKNILIQGENGTGKELLADYIRRKTAAGRRQRPLIVVNSARLTPENYQVELFGYKQGTFSEAKDDRAGALRRAEGGDLFLDEVAELHEDVQAGLLRLLESREYSPLGAPEERIQLKDVRFLSATNAHLQALVGRGVFREDLYFRLKEFGDEVYLPPLRERASDIPELAESFVRKFEQEFAACSRTITDEALSVLCRYPWPGNIRELRNCLYPAVSRFDEAEHLTPAHLPAYLIDSVKRGITDTSVEGSGIPFGVGRFELTALDQLSRSDARLLAAYLRAALDSFLRNTREDSD